jgi:hypothetical protein
MTQDYIAFEGIIEQHGEINAAFVNFLFYRRIIWQKRSSKN